MPENENLEALHALIIKTKALDDATRQKLLEKMPKLTEEQVTQLEKVITAADQKLIEIDQETQKKIDTENQRYSEALKEFRMKTIPQALKIAEKEHRVAEEAAADDLLKQAASL